MTTCLICNTTLDYVETAPIPESVLAKISPKRTIEEALWEFIHHTPGVCSDCNQQINEFSAKIKGEMLSVLTPDRKAFLDSITDKLTDMSKDTVDAIINSIGSKTIPPEAYDILSREIAQEFAIIVAASMLYDGDDQMLQTSCSDPEKFIREVWRNCGGK